MSFVRINANRCRKEITIRTNSIIDADDLLEFALYDMNKNIKRNPYGDTYGMKLIAYIEHDCGIFYTCTKILVSMKIDVINEEIRRYKATKGIPTHVLVTNSNGQPSDTLSTNDKVDSLFKIEWFENDQWRLRQAFW